MSEQPQRYPPPLPRRFLAPRFWPAWLLSGLLWLLGRLPMPLRHSLGNLLGGLALGRNGKRAAITATNLEWCLPELDTAQRKALQRRFGAWLGRSFIEFGFLWWSGRRRFFRHVRFEGLEQLETMLARDEKVILFTLHTLAMDIGGTALSARVPMSTFANTMRNPLLEWLMAERRGRFGCRIHPRSGGLRPVIKDIKAGRILFFPCDEDQGLRQAETVFAPFFGIPKATLTSPLRLARLSGARLMPCSCWFDAATRSYVVKVWPPLDLQGDEHADCSAINRAFETAIRLAPEQYLWSQRLFVSNPDGLPPPYRMKGKPGSGPRPRPQL